MSYRKWKQWVQSLPWSLRWFVFLVLFRPLLDIFYYLKDISPFLSPLYIVGVMTPVLIAGSFLSKSFPRKENSSLDWVFGVWGVLLFFNVLAALTWQFSLYSLEIAFKLLLPIVLYFFLRHLIRSKRDLMGILTTFLYSSLIPFGMLLYEKFFTSIRADISRGMMRSSGAYADVISYAIYWMGALLVASYIFLGQDTRMFLLKRARLLIVVCALCLLGLLTIHHLTTWGVFFMLIGLLIFYSTRSKHIPAMLLMLLIGIVGFYFIGDTVNEKISVLIEVDMRVLEGDLDSGRALHGRFDRWRRYIEQWEEMPVTSKLFGVSLTPSAWRHGTSVLGGVHNDYLRILFASGLLGLSTILLFYVILFFKSWSLAPSEKFLVQGAIALMLLYSITKLPSFGCS